MCAKKWIKIWWFNFLVIIPIIGIFNFVMDPYGFSDDKNKLDENLMSVNNQDITNIKLNTNADIYLIGTSRLEQIHPEVVERYTDKHIFNIGISGSTFTENHMLAQIVKDNSKNLIFGFDAFSLNATRLETQKKLKNRYQTYKDTVMGFGISSYSVYLTLDFLKASIREIKRIIFGIDSSSYRKIKDSRNYEVTLAGINEHVGIDNKTENKPYTNYKVYNDQNIIDFAQILSEDDMVIIYPKHYYHYVLFNRHQDIEKQYLNAVKVLVNNTKAKVWSFYQVNELTKSDLEFDRNGWHFKPRNADLIFKKIYTGKSDIKNFGIELNSNNIDQYILEIQKTISALDMNELN